ncbi:uncharacterized protein LOC106637824 [Copidosoma floridanum]|uniref:uncharacterized protein LOC106637824 n=1 Tax=Copidosoma floridanum TaxID=29053 RepID=UPI0006C962BA|nr:uncharacterized protein LOC106637824 [Copidosoma floridanum]
MGKEIKKSRRVSPYSKNDLQNAFDAVKTGTAINEPSRIHKVPYATLYSRVKGIYPLETKKGPSSILSPKEEKDIVNWIFSMSKCGFPVTKQHLLDSVQIIVKNTKRITPFTDGRPSKHWYAAFLRRNPELSEKFCQNLTKARSNVSQKSFRDWYAEVGNYLEKKNLLNVEPNRIFNCDESAFMLCPKTDKVLTERGNKNVYNVCKNDKECYTALIGGSAAGQLIPPMIINNYDRIPKVIAEHFPSDFILGKSESGWMTSETFYSYVVNQFYPWCVRNNIQFPVILYVDGHSSHLTKALSDFCCDHQIELIGLVPNATHLHQPMDVGLFRPLKTAYKKEVRNWRLENNGQHPTKCGLYPFNERSIDFSRLISGPPVTDQPEQENQDSNVHPHASLDKLKILQSFIEPDILNLFKENKGQEWTGAIEYKELFKVWSMCDDDVVYEKNNAPQSTFNLSEDTSCASSEENNSVEQLTSTVVEEILVCEGDQLNISNAVVEELVDNGSVVSGSPVELDFEHVSSLRQKDLMKTDDLSKSIPEDKRSASPRSNVDTNETLDTNRICEKV